MSCGWCMKQMKLQFNFMVKLKGLKYNYYNYKPEVKFKTSPFDLN